jgi:hypothetical protein
MAGGGRDPARSFIRLFLSLLKPGTWTTLKVRIENGKIRLVTQENSWTPDTLPEVEAPPGQGQTEHPKAG